VSKLRFDKLHSFPLKLMGFIDLLLLKLKFDNFPAKFTDSKISLEN